MGITINHAPAAAVVGQSAALGGAGQLAKWWAEMQNAKDQAAANRIQSFNNQMASQNFQREQTKSNQQFQREQSNQDYFEKLDLMGAQAENQRYAASDALEAKQALEKTDQEQWETRYTAKQNSEIAEVNRRKDLIQQAIANGTVDQQRGGEMLLQAEYDLHSKQPMKFPKEKSPWPEGQDVGQVWHPQDEGGQAIKGVLATRDTNGKVTFHDVKDTEEIARAKAAAEQVKVDTKNQELETTQLLHIIELEGKMRGMMSKGDDPRPIYSEEQIQDQLAPMQARLQTIQAQNRLRADQRGVAQMDQMRGDGVTFASEQAGFDGPVEPAQEAAVGQAPPQEPQLPAIPIQQASRLPAVKSKADVAKLPSGSLFIDPNGVVRRMP